YDYYLLNDSEEGSQKIAQLDQKPPSEQSIGKNVKFGFVLKRAHKVSLGSIVRNSEIDVIWQRLQELLEPLLQKLNKALKQTWEEWQVPRDVDDKWSNEVKQIHAQWWEARLARQKEINDSIKRSAEIEYLYDRPYTARGVVRVAGPFTVESLSPHRVL